MKVLYFSYLLVCLFAVAVVTISPQKAVIVTYPEDTPDSILDQAKDAIRKAGGMITHDYKLIKYITCAPFHTHILTSVQRLRCSSIC
jgi:hypothetical protein